MAYACQNLFGSHDVNRIGSHIVNRGIGNFRDWGTYYSISKAIDNPDYSPRKPGVDDIRLQKLFAIMQMSYVGAPMIYYGDEVGMWGANDPDCRKPMVWNDLAYENEVTNPDQSIHKPDVVEVNHDLFHHYQKLIQIRNSQKALQIGDFKTLITDDKNELYAFSRSAGNETVWVIINASDVGIESYPLPVDGILKDLIEGNEFESIEGKVVVNIKPQWGLILIRQTKASTLQPY